MKKVNQRIDALLLVGGFSGNEYLFKSVQVSGITLRRAFRKGHSERDLIYF